MRDFESIWYISQEMDVSIGSYQQKRITDLCNYWFTDLLVSFTSSRNSSLQMSCFPSFRCHSFYHYLNRSVSIKMSARASPVHAVSFKYVRCQPVVPFGAQPDSLSFCLHAYCYSYCLCLHLFFCVSVLLQLWTVLMTFQHFLVPLRGVSQPLEAWLLRMGVAWCLAVTFIKD